MKKKIKKKSCVPSKNDQKNSNIKACNCGKCDECKKVSKSKSTETVEKDE